jgi:DNA-binding transcriptional regulator YdaS (Cro superfamily)
MFCPPSPRSNAAGLHEAMRVAAALKAETVTGKRRRIGGLRSLAELLGLSASAVSGWRGEIPLSRVLQVEAKTGVPRHVLRPDHWNAPMVDAGDAASPQAAA